MAARDDGLTVLKASDADTLDIVFVHGLNGHAYDTWTSQPRSDQSFCWIEQLPNLVNNARTMTFGYNSRLDGGSGNMMGIRQHAQSLLQSLSNERDGSAVRGTSSGPYDVGLTMCILNLQKANRPIVFVCHSLGGLVVKQALNTACTKQAFSPIIHCAEAVFFFGTPHRGSSVLSQSKRVTLVESLAKAVNYEIPPDLRSALQPGSAELFGINDVFADVVHMKKEVTIFDFYEQKVTQRLSALVVDRESAVLQYPGEVNVGLARSHVELVKFENADANGYDMVVKTISRQCQKVQASQKLPKDYVENGMKEDLLKSLYFPGLLDRSNNLTEKHFAWLWTDASPVMDWMQQGRGLLWISGKPGSGKSTLMKEINTHLQDDILDGAAVSSFFFTNQAGDTTLHSSFQGMLQYLFWNILTQAPSTQDLLLNLWKRRSPSSQGVYEWSESELKRAMRAIITRYDRPLRLIFLIDALDECNGGQSVDTLLEFFEELLLIDSPNVTVKVCVSSRRFPFTYTAHEVHQGFHLEERTHDDIHAYVEKELLKGRLFKERSAIQPLIEEVVGKANGVFLWVELVLRRLKSCMDMGDGVERLSSQLSTFAPELMRLYGEILGKVDLELHQERNQILAIVFCCLRALSIPEVSQLMDLGGSIHSAYAGYTNSLNHIPVSRRLQRLSGGLIEIRRTESGKEIVQFMHQSVINFLESEFGMTSCGTTERFDFLREGHSILARACINGSINPNLKELQAQLRNLSVSEQLAEMGNIHGRFPSLEYAVSSWMVHAEKAEQLGVSQTEPMAKFESAGPNAWEVWLELHNHFNKSDSLPGDTSPLSIAIMLGLQDFVRERLRKGAFVNHPVQQYGHYLQIAASRGSKSMLELLIENGADVNATGGQYHTPLQAAAYSGKLDAVRALTDAGAALNLRGGVYGDPLKAAAKFGHKEIVELLLERDVDGQLLSNGALRDAAGAGHDTVVQLLLENGADIQDPELGELGVNAMFWAMLSSSEATVNAFLECGQVDVTTYIFPGITILHWFSLHGPQTAVEFLVRKMDADVNALDFNGSTPLHWAASGSPGSILEELLDAGAEPNTCNNNGVTPLHMAAANGILPHFEALLGSRASPAELDNMQFSVLHHAALNPSADILNYLLESEPEDIQGDVFGRMPIHIAAEFGCLQSFLLLMNCTEDLDECDGDGHTVLHFAASNTSIEVLEACLERDCDKKAVDGAKMSALHWVFNKESPLPNLDLFPVDRDEGYTGRQRMRKKSKKKEKQKSRGRIEKQYGRVEQSWRPTDHLTRKLQLLVQAGVPIDLQDIRGSTALHYVCSAGNAEAVILLLDSGAKKDILDMDGCLPLDRAQTEEVRMLFKEDIRDVGLQLGGKRRATKERDPR